MCLSVVNFSSVNCLLMSFVYFSTSFLFSCALVCKSSLFIIVVEYPLLLHKYFFLNLLSLNLNYDISSIYIHTKVKKILDSYIF